MSQVDSDSKTPINLSYRNIIAIAAPVLVANLAMPLQGAIDIGVVGHFDESYYLAGLGIASQLWLLILVSFNFLQYATSGLSAQAFGKISTTSENTTVLIDILYRSLGLAILLSIILWLFKPLIISLGLNFLAAQPASSEAANSYLSVRYYGIAFELMNYAFIGWFAGQGKTKQMMMVQLLISTCNIILTLCFVYGLKMGLHGVALGTVIGYFIGCATAAYIAIQHMQQLKLRQNKKASFNLLATQKILSSTCKSTLDSFRNKLIPNLTRIFAADKMLSLFALNKDIFIRTILLTLSFAWITRLSAQQGDLIMATNAVLLQVLSISAFALDGVAVAAESLSGQTAVSKGKKYFQLAVKRTGLSTLVLAVTLCIIWQFALPTFLSLMTDLEEVKNLAFDYRYVAVMLPLIGAGAYWLDGIMFGLTAGSKIRQVAIIVAILFFPLTWLINEFYSSQFPMLVIWFSVYLLLISRFVVASIILWVNRRSLISN